MMIFDPSGCSIWTEPFAPPWLPTRPSPNVPDGTSGKRSVVVSCGLKETEIGAPGVITLVEIVWALLTAKVRIRRTAALIQTLFRSWLQPADSGHCGPYLH